MHKVINLTLRFAIAVLLVGRRICKLARKDTVTELVFIADIETRPIVAVFIKARGVFGGCVLLAATVSHPIFMDTV